LEKKLERYSGEGTFRVVFFMRNQNNADLDRTRLNKLFEIVKRVMYKKPNRVLGACYSDFLRDGKIFNLKGEVVDVS